MKVLITGGVGFIGQHLARRLAPDHALVALDCLLHQVHLDADASRAAFPGEVVVADVSDPTTWGSLPRPDALVHLAAETGTGQSMYEQDRYARVNVDGTRLAGEAAARWNVPLISMSSRAVYGEGRYECSRHGVQFGGQCCTEAQPAPSQEGDEHHPVSVYGETKSAGESALSDIARHIPVTIIRPQNVVGPGQALHNPYTGVLAAFLARLREGKDLLVYGDGSATRDFVHVSDLAALIDWALSHPPESGTARLLNSGTGIRTSLDELAQAAIDGSPRSDLGINHVDVHRAGDIEHACADLALLRAAGAPPVRWTSRAAIMDFIAWSWDKPGATSRAWDDALKELDKRGLTQ
ncbi:MAG: NAD-dependent epimerase/dehydratase family protein [Nostocoides sp.]